MSNSLTHSEALWLAVIQVFVPAMTAIFTGWAAFRQFLKNQNAAQKADEKQREKDNITRLIEAQKPFLSLQLERYSETAKVIGQIVTLDLDSERDNWLHAEKRFWQLFYTELSLVEDKTVKKAMEKFGGTLEEYSRAIIDSKKGASAINEIKDTLKYRAYKVATALQTSIKDGWSLSIDVDPAGGPKSPDVSQSAVPRGPTTESAATEIRDPSDPTVPELDSDPQRN